VAARELFPLRGRRPKKTGQDKPAPQGALLNTGGLTESGGGMIRPFRRSGQGAMPEGTRGYMSKGDANFVKAIVINELRRAL
jgi:hypothetical protein